MGGLESQGIPRVGQTVLGQVDGVSDLALITGSVGGGFRKEMMSSARIDARQFSFSLYGPGAFQAAALLLEFRGSDSE